MRQFRYRQSKFVTQEFYRNLDPFNVFSFLEKSERRHDQSWKVREEMRLQDDEVRDLWACSDRIV